MTTPRAIFVWIRDFGNQPTPRLCYGFVPLYYTERLLAKHELTDDDESHIRAHKYVGLEIIDALRLRYPPPPQQETTP